MLLCTCTTTKIGLLDVDTVSSKSIFDVGYLNNQSSEFLEVGCLKTNFQYKIIEWKKEKEKGSVSLTWT